MKIFLKVILIFLLIIILCHLSFHIYMTIKYEVVYGENNVKDFIQENRTVLEKITNELEETDEYTNIREEDYLLYDSSDELKYIFDNYQIWNISHSNNEIHFSFSENIFPYFMTGHMFYVIYVYDTKSEASGTTNIIKIDNNWYYNAWR